MKEKGIRFNKAIYFAGFLCASTCSLLSDVFLFIFKLRTSTYFQSSATQLHTLLCIQQRPQGTW